MGVGNTGVKERDGRTFPSQWVKMCVSMFATLVLSVAVAECRYVSVRNGDKVTLPCGQHNGSCEGIDWLFNWRFYVTVHLVEKGKVSQRYVEEYGQLSLTSDCSLEIMKITEELAGQFHCRWGDPFQSLARIYLSVVSMTITENHQLSCSLKPQDECTSFVRWLYYGKPLDHEPKNGWQHTIPLCQDCEEPLREELFSCEVWNDCSGDQSVFPLSRQSEGHKATTPSTPTKTTMLSSTTGSTGGNSEETQHGVPGWWRHLVAVLVVAVLMCILVNFILSKRAKGKKKLQEENTVEPEAGVSSPSVSYTKKGAKVRAQVTDGGEAASSGGAADESTIYCNISTLDG